MAAESTTAHATPSSEDDWILVTGGAGYIGSHTVVVLLEAGRRVVVVDNLSNSSRECLDRVREISGRPAALEFVECDLRDKSSLAAVFARFRVRSVIHFAAFKAVGESKLCPLRYFDNNLTSTICLLEVMGEFGCKDLVFSSSCTVYGESPPPLPETARVGVGITNAYGRSKYIIEEMLGDIARSSAFPGSEFSIASSTKTPSPPWRFAILRYFNPVGAHESGRLGEDPLGTPNCLMPFLLQVLVGRREKLVVFGDDYPTRDGTCIRDYIHVMDVARGHRNALEWLERQPADVPLWEAFNFGTGRGTTVLELVDAVERAAGKRVPREVGPRRPGDLPATFCDPTKAATMLGWSARHSIEDMCVHAWRWQSANPLGYRPAHDADDGREEDEGCEEVECREVEGRA